LQTRKVKTKKHRIPTIEEFLNFVPKRADLEWSENSEGLIKIQVPKFKSNFGKSFCNFIKKDSNIIANMDKYSSAVWKNCNGKNTVGQILKIIEKKFPEEKDLDQRLFLFLQQMMSLNYIDL
jgi:hypothetical protein